MFLTHSRIRYFEVFRAVGAHVFPQVRVIRRIVRIGIALAAFTLHQSWHIVVWLSVGIRLNKAFEPTAFAVVSAVKVMSVALIAVAQD